MPRRLGNFLVLTVLAASVGVAGPLRAQGVSADCARLGDDDHPRPIPSDFVKSAASLFGFSSGDPDWVRNSTVYRCMGGVAWLCNYGANLTCDKADVSRVSIGADRYCHDFPGSEIVPMAATGHATIFTWTCVGQKARIKASEPVDPRGFIANQWKRLDR
jgi:hypothetical protein